MADDEKLIRIRLEQFRDNPFKSYAYEIPGQSGVRCWTNVRWFKRCKV